MISKLKKLNKRLHLNKKRTTVESKQNKIKKKIK